MKRIFISICLLTLIPAFALGQGSNKKIEEEILKLEQELVQAGEKSDFAATEKFLTDDYLGTAYIPAKVLTKEGLRANMAKPPQYKILSSAREDVKVRVYVDTAIVTGLVKQARKVADGKESNFEARFTHVWVKQKGKWLLAARHTSPAYGVFKPE